MPIMAQVHFKVYTHLDSLKTNSLYLWIELEKPVVVVERKPKARDPKAPISIWNFEGR